MFLSVCWPARPGSGGLVCNIGGFSNDVSPKFGSLGPCMVEAMMMMNMNIGRPSSNLSLLNRSVMIVNAAFLGVLPT